MLFKEYTPHNFWHEFQLPYELLDFVTNLELQTLNDRPIRTIYGYALLCLHVYLSAPELYDYYQVVMNSNFD